MDSSTARHIEEKKQSPSKNQTEPTAPVETKQQSQTSPSFLNKVGTWCTWGFTTARNNAGGFYNWAHSKIPLFSTVTGYRYPGVTHRKGTLLTGMKSVFGREHGIHIGEEITQNCASLAKQDSRGMCYWWVVNRPFILITNPVDIEQVMIHNKDNVDRAPLIAHSLSVILGETLLTSPANTTWKSKRDLAIRELRTASKLEPLAKPMGDIIEEHIQHLDAKETPTRLRDICTNIPLDVMSRTQLGTDSIAKDREQISAVYETAFEETIDLDTVGKQVVADIYRRRGSWGKKIVEKIYGLFYSEPFFKDAKNEKTSLEVAKSSLENMLQTVILKDEKEEKKLASKDTLITKLARQQQGGDAPPNLKLKAIFDDIGLFLLAGHDTTARLLEHLFMRLAKHPEVVVKLREEITKHRPASGKWEKSDIEKIPYVKWVLKETLRLHPSVPVLGVVVEKPFMLGEVPRTATPEEYKRAMANRNPAKDIYFKKGDTIFISPSVTQQLESVHKDPEKFRPERFEDAMPKGAWFPFSLGKRDCIGQDFALLEASLGLVKILEKYDYKIEEIFDFPIEEDMKGIMKPAHPLSARFFKHTPNDEKAATPLQASSTAPRMGQNNAGSS